MNTWISKGRVFYKKIIEISMQKEKQLNNRYQVLDKDSLNKKEKINNNNMIIIRIS